MNRSGRLAPLDEARFRAPNRMIGGSVMNRLEDLRAGLRLVHDDQPVKLLYFERRNRTVVLRRAGALFTGSPERPGLDRSKVSLSGLLTSRKAA